MISPLHFCALLGFLLLSRAGVDYILLVCEAKDCLVWGWSYPVWTKEYKRDQVLEKSVLELRFIVMGLRGIRVIQLT